MLYFFVKPSEFMFYMIFAGYVIKNEKLCEQYKQYYPCLGVRPSAPFRTLGLPPLL